jgi:hypothetical protein
MTQETRQFIRSERYPIRIARTSAGCLRMDVVENPQDDCAQLNVLLPVAAAIGMSQFSI